MSTRYDDREQWEAAVSLAEEERESELAEGILEKLGDTYQDTVDLTCDEQDFLTKILPNYILTKEEKETNDRYR